MTDYTTEATEIINGAIALNEPLITKLVKEAVSKGDRDISTGYWLQAADRCILIYARSYGDEDWKKNTRSNINLVRKIITQLKARFQHEQH